jgi:hypothetical protein
VVEEKEEADDENETSEDANTPSKTELVFCFFLALCSLLVGVIESVEDELRSIVLFLNINKQSVVMNFVHLFYFITSSLYVYCLYSIRHTTVQREYALLIMKIYGQTNYACLFFIND